MIKNVTQIWNMAEEFRPAMRRGMLYGVLESLCGVLPFGILLCFLKAMLEHRLTLGMLVTLTLSILIVYFLQFCFHFKETATTSAVGYDIIAKKRIQIAAFLKKIPMGRFLGQSLGNILSILTNELTQIELYAMQMVSKVVSSIATILLSMSFLAMVHPVLCLCYFVGFPIAYCVNRVIQHLQKNAGKRRVQAQETLIDEVVEYTQGIETVRAYNIETTSQKGIHQAFETFSQNTIHTDAAVIPWMQCHSFFLYLGTVLVLSVGMHLVTAQQADFVTYFLFCIAGIFLFQPFEVLSAYEGIFHAMTESLQRVEELMQLTPIKEPKEAIPFANYNVEFQNVTFAYDKTPTVQHITFRAPQNTMTAIVGMSGSGKTTLMQLLMRYWDIDEGAITIGGHNLQDYPMDTLMNAISVVFQHNYLFRDTIYRNITMGKPHATKEEVIAAARRACCHDFIMALPNGYDTMVEEGGNSLSGGECQRIAIARAILKDAPIVILDEATSGIDPVNEAEIQQAIQELARSKTVFIIAHKFSTIQQVDQILVMEQGKLVEQGTHETLLAQNGRYANLWNKQQGLDDWKLRWHDAD